MQRYFVDKKIIDEKNMQAVILDKEVVHHIRDVMRMNNGDRIILLDNLGYEYLSEIVDLSNRVVLKILTKCENHNELNVTVDIYHGLVRREKKEETLRRLVEFGAHAYIPVIMERSIVKMDKYKENDDRIKTIIKECSEQAERGRLMEYGSPISFKDYINKKDHYDYNFVCFEDSGRNNDKKLMDYLNQLNGKKISVLVGPEGGISPSEVNTLKENGFIFVGLGKRILRTETAPLFIMALLGYHAEMGDNNE